MAENKIRGKEREHLTRRTRFGKFKSEAESLRKKKIKMENLIESQKTQEGTIEIAVLNTAALLSLNEKVNGGFPFTNELDHKDVFESLPGTRAAAIRRAEAKGHRAALYITKTFTAKVTYKVGKGWTDGTRFADLLNKGYKLSGHTYEGQDVVLLNWFDQPGTDFTALLAELNLTNGTCHGHAHELANHSIELMTEALA